MNYPPVVVAMNWPNVAVLIVTWNRPDEIRRTIAGLQKHLKYPGKLCWHLADDGTGGSYIADIKSDFPGLYFSHTVTNRAGWGANVNTGMQALWRRKLDYIFLCEDDYLALRDVDLSRGVTLMEAVKNIGLVRYDGIAAHGERGMELQLRSIRKPRKIPYLNILKSSAHLNVYSHRPHLVHRRFHQKYGHYSAGLTLAQTETDYACRVKRNSGPDVAILPDYLFTPFRHMGRSRQGTADDVGRKEPVEKPTKKAKKPRKAGRRKKGKGKPVATKPGTIKLNVGCGTHSMKGYIGVDKFKTSAAQVTAPAHKLPYEPGTVDEIFTSHMIEHLTPTEQDLALKEWHRVLKPGGILRIRCPNFELYVREYLGATENERYKNPWLLRNIFGWRNKPGQFHMDGFTVGRFQRMMPDYGFCVTQCKTIRTRASKGIEYRPNGDIICVCVKT